MKEIQGNLWNYYQKPGYAICITTNGTIKGNGCGVMGRGCAKEARDRIPGLERLLGDGLIKHGNVFQFATDDLAFFPTKHNWYEKSDPDLIVRSAKVLATVARASDGIFILPRPGCGNGGLRWEDVKPLITFLPDNVWVISG